MWLNIRWLVRISWTHVLGKLVNYAITVIGTISKVHIGYGFVVQLGNWFALNIQDVFLKLNLKTKSSTWWLHTALIFWTSVCKINDSQQGKQIWLWSAGWMISSLGLIVFRWS